MPILLLWDDFSAHWTEEVVQFASKLNVHLMRVLPGTTSACQPADISWNKPLKDRLHEKWTQHVHRQLDGHSSGSLFRLRPPCRQEVVEWVSKSWSAMDSKTIQSGFSPISCGEESDIGMQIQFDQLAARLHSMKLLNSDTVEIHDNSDIADRSLIDSLP